MLSRWQDRDTNRARMARRAYPIHAYVGPNGTGKTACMVHDTVTSLEWGRPVLSTVRLLDYRDPRPCPGGRWCDNEEGHEVERVQYELVRADPDDLDAPLVRTAVHTGIWDVHRAPHPLYVRFVSYQQLLEAKSMDVLMDEVTGIASSRDSASGMPTQVANMLVQLRRRNVVLRWSAPAWGRADKIIREVSQAVTLTSARMPRKAPPRPGEPPRLWRERRLFIARTFAGDQFDEFDAHRSVDVKPMVRSWLWGPSSQMFSAYDTYDAVTALGWAQESGLCGHCGGHRARRKCGCPDEHVSPAAASGSTGRAKPRGAGDEATGTGLVLLPAPSPCGPDDSPALQSPMVLADA